MDGPTAFYIVVFIAVLNVIAFSTVNDWKAVVFMALAAGATYAVSPDQTLALVVGIVASNLYRASSSMQEGMADQKKKKKEKEKEEPEPPPYEDPEAAPATPDPAAVDVDPIESMVKNMDIKGMLAKQSELMEGIKSMGPLMAKGNEMIAKLPRGFLTKAMNNMNLKK